MKTLDDSQFNPQMVVLARETRGLTQSELADRLSVTQGKLSKIESGYLQVSQEDINNIASTLNYPIHFFFQKDSIYGPGVSELFHRKRQSMPIKLLKKNHAIVQLRHMQIERLLKSVDIGNINISTIDIDEPEAPTPEQVAKMTRAAWNLPAGPINNVVAVIEDAGGIIVPCDLDTNKIDAMSRWIPGTPPLFFVNTRMPADRVRFTLCHELGHIIMHRIPNSDMESQADAFAAEFLMPSQDIRSSLDNLTLDKLSSLKQYWKVAMSALVYRAKTLNKITENQARYLYMQMARLGYKTKEPDYLEPPKEQPQLFYDLARVHLEELNYTARELSDFLLLNDTEFKDIFTFTSRRLSIVR
jgi:Zn-dependent peptidase ImmA (M78 family)/transcriptional regulator with XRE-family HTH domain